MMGIWDFSLPLRQAAAYNPRGIASRTLTVDGTHISKETTWMELHRNVKLLSIFLQGLPMLNKGHRLGVLGRNCEEYLELLYACGTVNVVVVPLNIRWSVEELLHAIVDSGMRVLVILEDDFLSLAIEKLIGSKGSSISHVVVGRQVALGRAGAETWQCMPLQNHSPSGIPFKVPLGLSRREESNTDLWLRCGETLSRLKPSDECNDLCAEDVFCIVYTSGTTGRSKGVELTHQGQVVQAMGKCLKVGYTQLTIFLNVVPLFHVGGISSSLAVTMAMGCHVFLPRFTPSSAVNAVQTARVNTLVVVPTMLHMMLESSALMKAQESRDGATASPLGGVKTVLVGGQPLSYKLGCKAQKAMPKASFTQTYACTEAGSTITFSPFSYPILHQVEASGPCAPNNISMPDSSPTTSGVPVGIPAQYSELRVVEVGSDLSTSQEVTHGVVGEIETRGPHVMKGYWRQPELTAATIRTDGWMRTGDLGWLEEGTGRLHFMGRQKTIIKTGGENVYSSEVENVLLAHAWVAEAVVYGVKDELLGEKVAASVVLERKWQVKVADETAQGILRDFCKRHLSSYKQPREICVVPELPKNSSGKVEQLKLRASL